MAARQATPPLDGDANVRKRVCKACDRCRLKKSKCDGTTPCGRCRSDNAICVFGERKKSHDKVYPKGYVEMLEHQQTQLVSGLQELYKRVVEGQPWGGPLLVDSTNGRPLTHDILEALGVLQLEPHCKFESFEEDTEKIQKKLVQDGADMMQRRPSVESEYDQESNPSLFESTGHGIFFNDPFVPSQLPTPPLQSPTGSQFTRSGASQKWSAMQKTNQGGPQPLQIHTGYGNWDPSIDPVSSHTQPWIESPTTFDGWPHNDCYPVYSSVDAASANLTVPDWTGDINFEFLNNRM